MKQTAFRNLLGKIALPPGKLARLCQLNPRLIKDLLDEHSLRPENPKKQIQLEKRRRYSPPSCPPDCPANRYSSRPALHPGQTHAPPAGKYLEYKNSRN